MTQSTFEQLIESGGVSDKILGHQVLENMQMMIFQIRQLGI